MKLSQMDTDRLLDFYAAAAPVIEEIKNGDHFPEIESELQHLTQESLLLRVLPMLLKHHRRGVYEILAAMGGKTADEVAKQPPKETLREARELLSEDFVDFFTQLLAEEPTESSPPSAATGRESPGSSAP